jgi:hypothetical protein
VISCGCSDRMSVSRNPVFLPPTHTNVPHLSLGISTVLGYTAPHHSARHKTVDRDYNDSAPQVGGALRNGAIRRLL